MWRSKQARTTFPNYLTVKLHNMKLWNYEAAKLRLKLQGCDLFRVSFVSVKPSFVAQYRTRQTTESPRGFKHSPTTHSQFAVDLRAFSHSIVHEAHSLG